MTTRRLALAGVAGVAAVAVAVDQLSKTWALNALDDRTIGLPFGARFFLTFNSGAAFSIGSGQPVFFAIAAIIAIAVIAVIVYRTALDRLRLVAFGLIIGGALGNLTDRLLRDHDGRVVDFIDFGWWPVFNLADTFLFLGVALLVLDGWRSSRA